MLWLKFLPEFLGFWNLRSTKLFNEYFIYQRGKKNPYKKRLTFLLTQGEIRRIWTTVLEAQGLVWQKVWLMCLDMLVELSGHPLNVSFILGWEGVFWCLGFVLNSSFFFLSGLSCTPCVSLILCDESRRYFIAESLQTLGQADFPPIAYTACASSKPQLF